MCPGMKAFLQPLGLLTPPVPSLGCDFGSKPWLGGPKEECLF